MAVLTFRDIAIVLTPIFILIVGIGVGVIGYFLKSLHTDIKSKFKATEKKIDLVERDLVELKTQMPRLYVLKDDYVRTLAGFESHLTGLSKQITELARDLYVKP